MNTYSIIKFQNNRNAKDSFYIISPTHDVRHHVSSYEMSGYASLIISKNVDAEGVAEFVQNKELKHL